MKKPIEFTKVVSSNITGYKYVASEKKLYIEFANSRTYFYEDVSQREFDDLFDKESTFGKKLYSTIVNKKKYEEIW